MAGPATRFGTYKVTEWREGVQPQKTWIQKRIWKPRSSRFSGGKGCSRRKHGYRKESGSRALLAFLAGRGAAAENMDTEKNLEAALFSLFWREGVQPQKTWIQKRIWKPRSSRFSGGKGCSRRKTWIQKRIWKPRSSRFSGGKGCSRRKHGYRKESGSRALLAFLAGSQGLVQTGLALHPMSRNRWSLEISSLKMFRLQCGLFLTQDVSPAVWRWRLLNARCFACSFWMAPSCLPFEHCNINFSCHSNIALWSAIL